MTNDKTIKQLADDLGVSKQTVQYHYKSLPTKGSETNDKGVIVLNSFGIKWLSDKIKKKTVSFVDKETAEESTKNIRPYELVFMDQLKEKDKQIMKLIENQEKLQKLLDQQQILTLQANKKIEELELKNYEQTKKEEDESVSTQNHEVKEAQTKKSFWSKLFGN